MFMQSFKGKTAIFKGEGSPEPHFGLEILSFFEVLKLACLCVGFWDLMIPASQTLLQYRDKKRWSILLFFIALALNTVECGYCIVLNTSINNLTTLVASEIIWKSIQSHYLILIITLIERKNSQMKNEPCELRVLLKGNDSFLLGRLILNVQLCC